MLEHLKAARHVFELCAEQQVSQDSSPATDYLPLRRTLRDRTAFAEPAAEDAIVTFQHLREELRDVRRLMTEPCVHLKNPIAVCMKSLAVSANVSVNDATVLRRPDDRKLRPNIFQFVQKLARSITAHAVQNRKERDRLKPLALIQNRINKPDNRLLLIRHRTHYAQTDFTKSRAIIYLVCANHSMTDRERI